MTPAQKAARDDLTREISRAQNEIAAEAHRIKRPGESVLPLLRLTNTLTAAVRAQALFDAQTALTNIDAPRDHFGRLLG